MPLVWNEVIKFFTKAEEKEQHIPLQLCFIFPPTP